MAGRFRGHVERATFINRVRRQVAKHLILPGSNPGEGRHNLVGNILTGKKTLHRFNRILNRAVSRGVRRRLTGPQSIARRASDLQVLMNKGPLGGGGPWSTLRRRGIKNFKTHMLDH